MSIQDPRTSERYMPRWELWMPVFIHYAVGNVVNSLSTLEITTQSAQGVMISQTKAASDKLIGNVLILESHIMDLWREKDVQFEKARHEFRQFIKQVTDQEDIGVLELIEKATDFYHEILELMRRRGFLRFKPPRSFGLKHDE